MGAAAGMWTSQEAARRVEAARAGRVRVRATPATLQVYWRATARAKKETEERVRQFSADESVAVVCAILHRQAGSTRRKLSGDKPSTRLLTPEGVATRCPALFWSLYASSTSGRRRCSPGDVAFEQRTSQAATTSRVSAGCRRGSARLQSKKGPEEVTRGGFRAFSLHGRSLHLDDERAACLRLQTSSTNENVWFPRRRLSTNNSTQRTRPRRPVSARESHDPPATAYWRATARAKKETPTRPSSWSAGATSTARRASRK